MKRMRRKKLGNREKRPTMQVYLLYNMVIRKKKKRRKEERGLTLVPSNEKMGAREGTGGPVLPAT